VAELRAHALPYRAEAGEREWVWTYMAEEREQEWMYVDVDR
jgi:hypothetical protein